jgi:uncharacterized protein (TIGR00730 family)
MELLDHYLGDLTGADAALAQEIVMTALKLGREQVSRLDRKIVSASLKELRYAFQVFAPYKGTRKVSMFGSARTSRDAPEYEAARLFSKEIAERGWMVITGAGPGIMEAGHEGAGGARSFGASITLPFEARPNPVIADDTKLINFKYYFTRKLTLMKEADAFVFLPGGVGTMDEAFELLTLVQSGKSDMRPIVMLDSPTGTFWESWEAFLRDELLPRDYITTDDLAQYRRVSDPVEAVREIERFYSVFHSQRVVGKHLVLRLTSMPSPRRLEQLTDEFADILVAPIRPTRASKAESADLDVPDLPRIALALDRKRVGRLRQLIDRLNEIGPDDGQKPARKGDPREV